MEEPRDTVAPWAYFFKNKKKVVILNTAEAKRKRLRALIQGDKMIRCPVAMDVLSGLLIEKAGFEATAIGGFPSVGSQFGLPDIGLLTMSEVVENCRRMSNAIRIPLFVDADTGYGGIPNVMRTVRELENAGASGIIVEDQVWPKRCGHMEGKQIVTQEEYLARIRAAAMTRQDPNLVIVARTDAAAIRGIDEAIQRANRALEAGADVAFVEAPQTLADLVRIPKEVKGPCKVNMLNGGKTPLFSHQELEKMGFRITVHPTAILFHYVHSTRQLLANLSMYETTQLDEKNMVSFDQYTQIVGLPEIRSMEKRCME